MLSRKYFYFILLVLVNLVACTSTHINHSSPIYIPHSSRIGLLPFVNMTETPQAEGRAATITEALLRSRGFTVVPYPNQLKETSLLPGFKPAVPRHQLLSWARGHNLSFAMMGTVSEWRYKIGLDGEPVVGITLELIRVADGHTVWTAVGSKSGGSRTALASTAQHLLESMLNTLHKI